MPNDYEKEKSHNICRGLDPYFICKNNCLIQPMYKHASPSTKFCIDWLTCVDARVCN